jgi:hypothetical protein
MRLAYWLFLVVSVARGQGAAASITGTAVDPSGAALPHAKLALFGQEQRETRTDENGSFVLTDLTPGPYTLKLSSAGFQTIWMHVNLAMGETRPLGSIGLKLAPIACDGEWITAHVNQAQIAETGNPKLAGWVEGAFSLHGVSVILRKTEKSRIVAQTPTDADGWFHFSDVPAGDYRLEVSYRGKTHLGADRLNLRQGFDVEVYTGWGSGFCIPAR